MPDNIKIINGSYYQYNSATNTWVLSGPQANFNKTFINSIPTVEYGTSTTPGAEPTPIPEPEPEPEPEPPTPPPATPPTTPPPPPNVWYTGYKDTVWAPNYFSSSGGTGEFDGEFWPGAGASVRVPAGIPNNAFQLMFGAQVFHNTPIVYLEETTYVWNGQTYQTPASRRLPLIEEVDRPYLEYKIDKLCGNNCRIILDEEYIGTDSDVAAERVAGFQAKMTLLGWAQAYGRGEGLDRSKGNRNMKFGYYGVAPAYAYGWNGYYGQSWAEPNPGKGGPWWTPRWRDTGPNGDIQDAPYNRRKFAAMMDFYSPVLYLRDNTLLEWQLHRDTALYCLYDSNDQWTLPKKEVIAIMSPQTWAPREGFSPSGTPIDLDILSTAIAEVNNITRNGLPVFDKVYWYIAASSRSWGDSRTGTGWWQLNPGTLPPQIQLIKDRVSYAYEGPP